MVNFFLYFMNLGSGIQKEKTKKYLKCRRTFLMPQSSIRKIFYLRKRLSCCHKFLTFNVNICWSISFHCNNAKAANNTQYCAIVEIVSVIVKKRRFSIACNNHRFGSMLLVVSIWALIEAFSRVQFDFLL